MAASSLPVPLYRDRWIECSPSQLIIRGYYFPSGRPKAIAYTRIRAVERFPITSLTGRWRIWGTTNPRYWAHLDPQRPRKQEGLLLYLEGFIRPWITPDDPAAVAEIINSRRAG